MTARRYDLDWLRIGAFGLLILYHIGMVFVPWGFHIKTAHPAQWVEAPMLLSNAWRLPLLFLISGVASRMMLARGGSGFAGQRSARLLWPLLFAVAVVVPPQAWVDVTLNHGYRASYLAFWSGDYWRFDGHLGVIVPTYNHLWFVAYLWVYTMLLAGGAALVRDSAALQARFDALFGGWRLVVLPLAWLAVSRTLMIDRFPETHALIDDWYAHLTYLSVFLFGIGLGGSTTLWPTIARIWRPAGVTALAAWVAVAAFDLSLTDLATVDPATLALMRGVRSVQCWGSILGLLGLAQRYWNHDHRLRSVLNEAVFPAYLVHQTVLILVEYWLRPFALPGWAEFAILVPVTAAGCAAAYLIGRRIGWLRPLIGLRPNRATAQPVITA